MGSIYGKPVKQPVQIKQSTTAFDAIQKLHKQVETINLSIKQKSSLVNSYTEKAKQCLLNGKREDAKSFLEKKVLIERRITQLIKMVSTLEQQISALESASINRDIVRAIEVSNEAIKNTTVSTDDVSQIMDSVREKIDDVNEVANILSEPIGNSVDVTDELNSLMPTQLPVEVTPLPMPAVPTTVHEISRPKTIEDEIRNLELA